MAIPGTGNKALIFQINVWTYEVHLTCIGKHVSRRKTNFICSFLCSRKYLQTYWALKLIEKDVFSKDSPEDGNELFQTDNYGILRGTEY